MKLYAILPIIAISACASPEYAQYTKAQTDIATARTVSESARYGALAAIAQTGDETSRTAAVLAIALSQGPAQPQVAAPQPNQFLQWASILAPALVQAYGIKQSASVAINASNNAASTSQATTAGFVNIAGLIQAAPTITTTTTTDRHDVISPAPVVVAPVTVIEPTVITPVVTGP